MSLIWLAALLLFRLHLPLSSSDSFNSIKKSTLRCTLHERNLSVLHVAEPVHTVELGPTKSAMNTRAK